MRIRTVPGLLLAIVLTPVFGLVVIFALGMNPFAESGYVYCVVAEAPAAFTGEWLRNDGRVAARTRPLAECESVDVSRDAQDGPKRGLVRWAVCPKGPDCDELGNF